MNKQINKIIPDYSFLRNLPGMMFIKDHNSIYLGMSRTVSDLLGCKTADYLIGRSDYDIPSDVCQSAARFITLDKQTIFNCYSKQQLIEKALQEGFYYYIPKRLANTNLDNLTETA